MQWSEVERWKEAIVPLENLSLAERRHLARAGVPLGTFHLAFCPGDCGWERWPREYNLFGTTVRLALPSCFSEHVARYWVGSREMDFLGELFRVRWETARNLEVLMQWHTRAWSWPSASTISRGPHHYYVLRDVVKEISKTYCTVCGARVRRIGRNGEDNQRGCLTERIPAPRSDDPWFAEFRYYCSEKCRRRYYVRQRRKSRRDERKREETNRWIRKARKGLKDLRQLIRQSSLPV